VLGDRAAAAAGVASGADNGKPAAEMGVERVVADDDVLYLWPEGGVPAGQPGTEAEPVPGLEDTAALTGVRPHPISRPGRLQASAHHQPPPPRPSAS
jgi:hypothetical protein